MSDGQLVGFSNGSPVFDSQIDVIVNDGVAAAGNRGDHFKEANQLLADAMRADPTLMARLGITETADQVAKIGTKGAPGIYSWHHHEEFGRLQLVVNDSVHAKVGHLGGHRLWPEIARQEGLISG